MAATKLEIKNRSIDHFRDSNILSSICAKEFKQQQCGARDVTFEFRNP